jgi:hypothetical protein
VVEQDARHLCIAGRCGEVQGGDAPRGSSRRGICTVG